MEPNASTGRTWLASSKTTRSKSTLSGGKYFGTDMGLIMNTGLRAWMAFPLKRTPSK